MPSVTTAALMRNSPHMLAGTHIPTLGSYTPAGNQTSAMGLQCRLGIKSLPWMGRIPPSMAISKDGAVRLKGEDLVQDSLPYPWSAETIAGFVEDKTGVKAGEIKRTSFLHSRSVDQCKGFEGSG